MTRDLLGLVALALVIAAVINLTPDARYMTCDSDTKTDRLPLASEVERDEEMDAIARAVASLEDAVALGQQWDHAAVEASYSRQSRE